jgi:hypothetical protein
MRQRLGLAGALLGEPSVLLLDEPANGLDPQGIRWLREFLRSFASRGNAVLVSSHLLAELAQMADAVIVIHHGRLVRQGEVAELTAGASTLRVASPQPDRLAAVLQADGMAVGGDGDGRLVVRDGSTRNSPSARSAAGPSSGPTASPHSCVASRSRGCSTSHVAVGFSSSVHGWRTSGEPSAGVGAACYHCTICPVSCIPVRRVGERTRLSETTHVLGQLQ